MKTPFTVKQLAYDLTPVAGLALVGHHIQRLAPVFKGLDRRRRLALALRPATSCAASLLVQGKSDFDATRNFCGDEFFKRAPRRISPLD